MAAFADLKKVCEERPGRGYWTEVINLLEKMQLARGDRVLAGITLVIQLLQPINKVIGDLSNTDRVLICQDLRLEE